MLTLNKDKIKFVLPIAHLAWLTVCRCYWRGLGQKLVEREGEAERDRTRASYDEYDDCKGTIVEVMVMMAMISSYNPTGAREQISWSNI